MKRDPKNLILLALFLDGANFYKDLKRLGIKKIDYEKLIDHLEFLIRKATKKDCVFTHLWFFTGKPTRKRKEPLSVFQSKLRGFERFKSYLEKLGFEVVHKDVKLIYDKKTKKCVGQKCDLDTEIKITIKEVIDQGLGLPQIVYLFSGDSDFAKTAIQLKNSCYTQSCQQIPLGIQVIAVAAQESLSYELKKAVDKTIYLVRRSSKPKRL